MTRLMTATAICALSAGRPFADCETVTFSDVGWTDITATTAATSVVLDALGYETDIKLVLSVPVTYTSLAEGDVDIFLGNWMPTMEADIAPYREAGTVDTVRANLEGREVHAGHQRGRRGSGHRGFRRHRRVADALDGRSTASSRAMTATG
jgi:glycine betaine/proline transport system substrate-binding protein